MIVLRRNPRPAAEHLVEQATSRHGETLTLVARQDDGCNWDTIPVTKHQKDVGVRQARLCSRRLLLLCFRLLGFRKLLRRSHYEDAFATGLPGDLPALAIARSCFIRSSSWSEWTIAAVSKEAIMLGSEKTSGCCCWRFPFDEAPPYRCSGPAGCK